VRIFGLIACVASLCASVPAWAAADLDRWKQQASETSITRDDWGVAHIHGKTDADAVFGAIYAQDEDDFRRVEMNYLTALGRVAEAKGESALWQDLRQRLFIDPDVLKADYAKSPDWLKKLMDAWADGMNFYLTTHPGVKPLVIAHYEPWMALSFTEGSIGGDIEDAKLPPLAAFYGKTKLGMVDDDDREARGSNGIAIAPPRSADWHALLLINPHVNFYFRSEQQMTSDEGLDAYGASTWGQFFIYQGFNRNIGWMHTSTGVDAVDEFAETVATRNGKPSYRYGNEWRPLGIKTITLRYADGAAAKTKTFTAYYTSHGPIVRADGGKWIALALMNKPIEALEQSFLRTKADDLASYMKVAALQANSSNNTVFADARGEIAFLAPQFVPRRDNRFDYTKPVDGADPATDWQGLTPLDGLPHVVNPAVGWLFNSNNWPWSSAGPDSPRREDYPRYLDQAGENMRGIHATALLSPAKKLTPGALQALAFDPHLPGFARLIPDLVKAYDDTPASDALKAKLKDQIALLRVWDYRWSDHSLPTTLAVNWGDTLWAKAFPNGHPPNIAGFDFLVHMGAHDKLAALAEVSDRLAKDFGTWRIAWGFFNRFQRITNDIGDAQFRDDGPSLPVPFVYSRWGSLASFAAKRHPGTSRYYGTAGNSFVAIVDFGPRIRAVAISTGGQSGDPKSRHFDDQAIRYARGELRPVYFYPDDLTGHVERTYHPGAP
jgi:acyl-homoserine-lactone acylase